MTMTVSVFTVTVFLEYICMDDTFADTSADTSVDTPTIPPCRQAELFITSCALCGRKMRLKTLRYSHVCSRSFHPMQRALEQQVAANNAITEEWRRLNH